MELIIKQSIEQYWQIIKKIEKKQHLFFEFPLRMNLVIYYDRVVNKPTVSNSFPRYSTSFGARLRLSLNQ